MRICFAIDDSLDRPDGVQQYVLTLGAWYAKQGHDVHYICSNTSRRDIANIHSLSSAIPIKFNKNSLSFATPLKKATIRQFFNDNRIDLLHVQLPHNPLFSGQLIANAPEQTTIFGTFHVAPYGRFERIALSSLQFVYRKSRKKINQLYAVSEVARPFAEKTYRLPAKVVPNAINIQRFKSEVAGSKSRSSDVVDIRFMGRLVSRKGCQHLLTAVATLIYQHKITNIRVTIGGKGPQLAELRALAKKKEIDSYIDFVGFVAEDAKAAFLGSADIVVFPSTGGESFGIVLVEAIASGSLVLAGSNPGYRGVLVPSEALFDPEDTASFAAILAYFIEHPKTRQQTARLQANHIKKFDVAKVAQRLLGDYRLHQKKT